MKRTDFNELIEKAFSIGYECAFEEIEEKLYSDSEDEEKKSKKISLGDRLNIWSWKHLSSKRGRKNAIEDLSEKKSIKKEALKHAAMGGAISAGMIAGSGALAGADKKEIAKKALEYGAVNAVAGGLSMAGAMKLRRNLRKNFKKYDNKLKRAKDRVRVADGRMSQEDFAEKWGK